MFRHRWMGLVFAICLGIPWAWSQPYRVQGIVEDENRQPLADIPVCLIYDNGLQFETVSKYDGTFDFDFLPDGDATCFIKLPPGYQPVTPACPSYKLSVAQESYLTFGLRSTTTGVVVRFGSPRGNGPSLLRSYNNADAHLILEGLGDYHPNYPDSIVITGAWSIPSRNGFPLTTQSTEINDHLGFHGYKITAIPLPNERVQYEIQALGQQVLSQDGEIAALQLQTPPIDPENPPVTHKSIFFCMESVAVYSGDEIIDSKQNLGWHGILEFP